MLIKLSSEVESRNDDDALNEDVNLNGIVPSWLPPNDIPSNMHIINYISINNFLIENNKIIGILNPLNYNFNF